MENNHDSSDLLYLFCSDWWLSHFCERNLWRYHCRQHNEILLFSKKTIDICSRNLHFLITLETRVFCKYYKKQNINDISLQKWYPYEGRAFTWPRKKSALKIEARSAWRGPFPPRPLTTGCANANKKGNGAYEPQSVTDAFVYWRSVTDTSLPPLLLLPRALWTRENKNREGPELR